MDPRVTTRAAGLEATVQAFDAMLTTGWPARATISRIRDIRKQLEDRKAKAGELAEMIDAIDAKLVGLEGAAVGGKRGRDLQQQRPSLSQSRR